MWPGSATARHGVLFKGSEVIGDFSRLDTVVFDKTGTLTAGVPAVTETKYYGEDSAEALGYLASIERSLITPGQGGLGGHWGRSGLSCGSN